MIALLRLVPMPWLLVGGMGIVVAFGGVYGLGYVNGVSAGRVEAMKDTVAAYQKREGVDHAISGLDAVALCIELGGMPDECNELRGMEKDPDQAD